MTSFPPPRSGEIIDASGAGEPGKAQYNLRFVWRKQAFPYTIRAIVLLQRGRVRTFGGLRSQLRRSGYTARPTRVRNRPALLFTRRVSPGFYLAWAEQGFVYELLTGRPRAVPLTALRKIAAGLEPLSKLHVGSTTLPDGREGRRPAPVRRV